MQHNKAGISECGICEENVQPEDTFEMTDNGVQHYNCPCCLFCGSQLGGKRYSVPNHPGYGGWAPAFYCEYCIKRVIPNSTPIC